MNRPSAIWLYDQTATGYVDLTDNVRLNTAFTLLEDPNDKIFIGFDRRFIGLVSDLSMPGAYSGLTYEYQTRDNAWQKLSLVYPYNFDGSKYVQWVLPEDWIKFNFTSADPEAATGPDTVERYWVRVSASAVGTPAIVSRLRITPFATYTTPDKVAEALKLKFKFDNTTIPKDSTVEDEIRRAEDRIDYVTYKSWRFNIVSEDQDIDPNLQDFNRYGIFVRHRNLFRVYKVSLWNGTDFRELSPGRSGDYFVDYNRGIIYLTRLFMLPAAYGQVGRYMHWGFGEFKLSVKVDYAYGRDLETDREFYMAQDLANKQVGCELLRHADYAKYLIAGTDKVPLDRKIQIMQDDIDKKLEELKAVTIW